MREGGIHKELRGGRHSPYVDRLPDDGAEAERGFTRTQLSSCRSAEGEAQPVSGDRGSMRTSSGDLRLHKVMLTRIYRVWPTKDQTADSSFNEAITSLCIGELED